MSDYIQTLIQGHNYYLTDNHKRARYRMRQLANRLVGHIVRDGVLTAAQRSHARLFLSQHIYEEDLKTHVNLETCTIERNEPGSALKTLTVKVLFDKDGAVDLANEHIQLDLYFKSKYVAATIENQIMDPDSEASGTCSQSFKIHYKDIQ